MTAAHAHDLLITPRSRDARVQWRHLAADHLDRAGLSNKARLLRTCRTEVAKIRACPNDPDHSAEILLKTCRLRICPDCNVRAQRQMAHKYLRKTMQLYFNRAPEHQFTQVTLTTPFTLFDDDASDRLHAGWDALFKTFNTIFYRDTFARDLTSDERHYGKIYWKKRNVGYVGSAEYGAEGQRLHYHVILFGPRIDLDLLSKAWRTNMGLQGANRPHIKSIPPVENEVKGMLAYIGKLTTLKPADAPQLLRVIDDSRRIRSRGVFYGLGKPPKEVMRCPICDSNLASLSPDLARFYWRDSQRIRAMSKQMEYG